MELLTFEQHEKRLSRLLDLVEVRLQYLQELKLDLYFTQEATPKHLIKKSDYINDMLKTDQVFSYEEEIDKIIVLVENQCFVFSCFDFSPQSLIYEVATHLSSDDFSLKELKEVLSYLETQVFSLRK